MDGPSCLLILDSSTGFPLKVNNTFEKHMGKFYKFKSRPFYEAATDDDQGKHQAALKAAIEEIGNSTGDNGKTKANARNVEMVTLAGESGFPIKRHFDWTVGKGSDASILLVGEIVTEQSLEERERDQELIDFFQNAPIALHWLGGDGKVMWCNQTELNVLGYTAEEYIGQPIMKFCPDEQELVLEIFKTLGSGKTIKDVPVRFRTKDGRIVNLLIDSNVKYDKNGNFGHTRCFIRDDTGRKINEAKSKLLLEETKASLKMLDNFMSRSLHHMRTPLHVLQNVCDIVLNNTNSQISSGMGTPSDVESVHLLQEGQTLIDDAVDLIDDISDLAKFDQGAEYQIKTDRVELKQLGLEVFQKCCKRSQTKYKVAVRLELLGGGPAVVITDKKVLIRVLRALIDNALQATDEGEVSLKIGYICDRCTFTVQDSGIGLLAGNEDSNQVTSTSGTLPKIFQRYHQELLPVEDDDAVMDFQTAVSLRKKIDQGLSSYKKNSLGIGLSLTYHLVMALGGDLRYTSKPGETKFWFSLPSHCSAGDATSALLPVENIIKHRDSVSLGSESTIIMSSSSPTLLEESSTLQVVTPTSKPRTLKRIHRRDKSRPKFSASSIAPLPSLACPSKKRIVECGAPKSANRLVLTVEDTDACAKLLKMMLARMNCSSARAENGQVAVKMIENALPGMYDLILMDLRMPVMDGLEATRILKQQLKTTIPIVALTGEVGDDIRKQCVDIGFDDFCSKPMKIAQLKQLVEKFT